MKTKQSMRPTLHKLNHQRYEQKVELARNLAEAIENKTMEGMNLVFPAFIYSQILKANR